MGNFVVPITFYNSKIELEVEILGSVLEVTLFPDPIEIEVEIGGSIAPGIYIVAGAIEVTVSIISGYVITTVNKGNWVKWSDIGSLKFEINERNVAGERPLDWSGQVYQIAKLDKQVVAYGSNGVTLLLPVENKYGIKTINRIGLKGKNAFCGTEDDHFFIDKNGKMYHISGKGIELLDYSEYLGIMTNPVMSLDNNTGIVYICDGTYGFVYSTLSKSFGEGPVNVTGLGVKDGTLYVVAPEEIEVPKLNICTDIYDFGNRNPKTIQFIEIGTDLTEHLEAMIETRISNKDSFNESKWTLVNPSGIAFIPCFGVEFKIHLRSYIYEYLELDYIKVTGMLHGFSYLNQVQ